MRCALPCLLPLLKSGVVLVDTPGLGSTFTHNSDTTRKFVPQVDAGLILLGGSPPIGEEELRFLGEIRPTVPKMIYIINKSDQLSTAEREEVSDFTRSVLKNVDSDPELYLTAAIAPFKKISTDNQLDADGGVGHIRDRLTYLARAESLSLLKASLVRKGRQIGNDVYRYGKRRNVQRGQTYQSEREKTSTFQKRPIPDWLAFGRARSHLESDLKSYWPKSMGIERLPETCRKTGAGGNPQNRSSPSGRNTRTSWSIFYLKNGEIPRSNCWNNCANGRFLALKKVTRNPWSATGPHWRKSSYLSNRPPGRFLVSNPARWIWTSPCRSAPTCFSISTINHIFYEYEKVENWISARVMAYPVFREKVIEKALNQVEPLLDRNMGRVRADLVHRINEGARQFKHQVNQRVEEYKKSIEQAVSRGMKIRATSKKEREKQLESFRTLIARTEEVVQTFDRMG